MARFRWFALVAGLTVLLTAPASALASSPLSAEYQAAQILDRVATSTNPSAAFEALTPQEKALFYEATTPSGPVHREMTKVASALQPLTAGGQWYIVATVWQNNAFGQRLWTYNQELDWGSNGSYLTDWTATKWPSGMMAGWTYTQIGGDTPQRQSGGNGSSWVQVFGNGQFQFCLVGVCVNTVTPWVQERGNANGTYTWNGGY